MTTAPSAYETLKAHFEDTGRAPDYYDLILTGDLGAVGHRVVSDFFKNDGVDFCGAYKDCGLIIFDKEKQDVHAGGSGCGCSGTVLCGHILNGMKAGKWKNVLFCPTGALMSPTSVQQGDSICGICHALAFSAEMEGK